jgi:hypothetical protein
MASTRRDRASVSRAANTTCADATAGPSDECDFSGHQVGEVCVCQGLLLCIVRLSWQFSGSKGLRPGGLELRRAELNDSCCKGRTVVNNNFPVNNGQDHRSLGELVRRCCQWIVPYYRQVGAGPLLNDSAFFTN